MDPPEVFWYTKTPPGRHPGREVRMKRRVFQTITGRALDLEGLDAKEREFLAAVRARYKREPAWSEFAAWWPKALQRGGLSAESVAYRICQDLEARLGIAQDKVAAPDYRDYLADLIDERHGSYHRFCETTGINPGHLSRIFAGRSELSLQTLQRILGQLGAALVIEPGRASAERFSRERAVRALAAAVR